MVSGRRALTIEWSLMTGCGQSHELVKDMWKKLWLKFPGLTHSKSGNTGEKGMTSLNKTSTVSRGRAHVADILQYCLSPRTHFLVAGVIEEVVS